MRGESKIIFLHVDIQNFPAPFVDKILLSQGSSENRK